MIVLYRLDATAAEIAATFGASEGQDPWSGGHVAPGQFAPVITAGREFVAGPRPSGRVPQARMVPRLWGVPPLPSVSVTDPRRSVLTVRNADSPFWIGNLRNCEFRCLIPATAFMFWGDERDLDGRRRQRWFAPSDQAPCAFAGVWKDSEVPSFAILTCPSNSLLRQAGRDTMPVILRDDRDARHIWLNASWDRARALVAPYGSGMMREIAPIP